MNESCGEKPEVLVRCIFDIIADVDEILTKPESRIWDLCLMLSPCDYRECQWKKALYKGSTEYIDPHAEWFEEEMSRFMNEEVDGISHPDTKRRVVSRGCRTISRQEEIDEVTEVRKYEQLQDEESVFHV